MKLTACSRRSAHWRESEKQKQGSNELKIEKRKQDTGHIYLYIGTEDRETIKEARKLTIQCTDPRKAAHEITNT